MAPRERGALSAGLAAVSCEGAVATSKDVVVIVIVDVIVIVIVDVDVDVDVDVA